MSFMDETDERMRSDAEFFHVVDMLAQIARERGFTPYELKQIAYAAAMRVEMTAARTFLLPADNAVNRRDDGLRALAEIAAKGSALDDQFQGERFKLLFETVRKAIP